LAQTAGPPIEKGGARKFHEGVEWRSAVEVRLLGREKGGANSRWDRGKGNDRVLATRRANLSSGRDIGQLTVVGKLNLIVIMPDQPANAGR
jgi:hypothetical protein